MKTSSKYYPLLLIPLFICCKTLFGFILVAFILSILYVSLRADERAVEERKIERRNFWKEIFATQGT